MSLSTDDRLAIKTIIDEPVDGLAQQTAAGFNELHAKNAWAKLRCGWPEIAINTN